MASRYLLQIVSRDGVVVQFEPGRGVEKDLIEDCVRRIAAKGLVLGSALGPEFVETCVRRITTKGIGVGRTTAHVEQDIRVGLEESIFEVKTASALSVIAPVIRESIVEAILELKNMVRP